MAEAVFRHLTAPPHSHPHSNPHISKSISRIDSAGTAAYHIGSDPDSRTISTLIKHGIENYSHFGRQVAGSDFDEFDYILAMDRENLRNLQRLAARRGREASGKAQADRVEGARVMLFGDFGGVKGEEVVDPYYGANDGFEVAYEQMVRFTNGFVKEVWGQRGEERSGQEKG